MGTKVIRIKKKAVILLAFIIVLIIVGVLKLYTESSLFVPEKESAQDGTNINPVCYAKDDFFRVLKKDYSALERIITDSYIIPGLDDAVTLAIDDYSEVQICHDMIPQGIAVTDQYIFVSAYSESTDYCSVIFMLNKTDGAYLKTIVLNGNPHAGGIAYVPKADGLWIATNKREGKNTAQISFVSMGDIENYNLFESKAPIEYKETKSLEELPSISSISYYDGNLVAGYFRNDAHADMVRYTLNSDGSLKLPYDKSTGEQEQSHFYSYSGIEKTQGIAVNNNYVYISQSYGTKNSNLLMMKNNGTDAWIDFDDDEIISRIECPSYMEQIVNDGQDLYILFEGAATKYRNRNTSVHMDRIIKISVCRIAKA